MLHLSAMLTAHSYCIKQSHTHSHLMYIPPTPLQIDRASAGAIRRSKVDKANDPEEEDEFGYTAREYPECYLWQGCGGRKVVWW